jgi:hypothetical protein
MPAQRRSGSVQSALFRGLPQTKRDVHQRSAADGAQGRPELDLWNARAAEFVVFAGQYDAGKLTQGQHALAERKTISEYTSRAYKRQNDATIAHAATTQADAALAQVWAANRPVTCNRIGNTATCY